MAKEITIGSDEDWDGGESSNQSELRQAIMQTEDSPASPEVPGEQDLASGDSPQVEAEPEVIVEAEPTRAVNERADVADYTVPKQFVDEEKIRAEAEAIPLPNNWKDGLALWKTICKMPMQTNLQRIRKRIFRQRFSRHIFSLQQGSPVIHTGDAMCPRKG